MVQSRVDEWRGNLAHVKVEKLCDEAYRLAQLDPEGMDGTGALCQRLFQNPSVIELVDGGVHPGRAELVFQQLPGGGRPWPITVRALRDQRDEQLSLALAWACARFLAWSRSEEWDDAMLQAVALAIAMPLPAIGKDLAVLSRSDVAKAYVVDEIMVGQRARMLHGGHDSGERPSVTDDETLTRLRTSRPIQ